MKDQSDRIKQLEQKVETLETIKTPMIQQSTDETLRSVGNALEFLTHAEYNAEEQPDNKRLNYVHSMTRDVLLWSAIAALEYERKRINLNNEVST